MSEAAISFPMLGDFTINPRNYIMLGNFKIYWYGIIIATGFLLAVIYAVKRSKQFGLTPDNILDVIIIGVPLAVICARIYYVVFYWSLYKDNLIDIFKIRDGGLGMYGVLIGAVLGLVIYAKHKKISIPAFLDIVCIGFLIGQFVGRWGNFMNREAFGYETDIFCKMGLTLNGVTTYVHPTFLYESLWNFVGFIFLHFFSKKHRRFDGEMFLMYLAWYGFGRMFVEGLRTDSLYLFNTGIRVSQLLSLILFIGAVAALLIIRFKVHPDPANMFVNRKLAAEAAADTQKDVSDAPSDTSNDAEGESDTDEAITNDAEPESTDNAEDTENPDIPEDNNTENTEK